MAQPPFCKRVQPFLEKFAGGLVSPVLPRQGVGFQELRNGGGGSTLYVSRQSDRDRIALRHNQKNSCGVRLCLDEREKRVDRRAKPDVIARGRLSDLAAFGQQTVADRAKQCFEQRIL